MGSTPKIQTSFNAGEWAPALNARVDIQKYHSGAALLRNFFVDYRGGATTRPGTRFICPCLNQSAAVRLIPFQASITVSYVLEFGDLYVRPIANGAPILNPGITITGITNANPAVVTAAAHGYSNGQQVYLSGVAGMLEINSGFYFISSVTTNTFALISINSTGFGTYTSGGLVQSAYSIASPYTAAELFDVKYAQNVNTLVLCHPNHPPYQLILNGPTNWTLTAITFGSTATTPTGLSTAVAGLSSGSANYAYVVTSVDNGGQESGPSAYATASSLQDMRTTPGSITISWTAAAKAASYNVYKAATVYSAAIASGAQFGFIGNCTGTSFTDSNIGPDFSQGPPVVQNPFAGGSVQSITLTNTGAGYLSVPTVSITASPSGVNAAAAAYLTASSISMVSYGGNVGGVGYVVNNILNGPGGIVLRVTSVDGRGAILTFAIVSTGTLSSGAIPANPWVVSGGSPISPAAFTALWWVSTVVLSSPGAGYLVAPTVTIVGGSPQTAVATATATLTSVGGSANSFLSYGNPTVPGFFQQRLALMGPVLNPQAFNFSQPGSPYNFNLTNPIAADNAISGTLVSGQLNNIQSMIGMPSGLVVLSDHQAWLINGGSPGAPISAIQIVANSQAYNGASSVMPIVANADILYVQSKQSIIRDLVYNFYTNVYTGTDISVLSSHLFYGYKIIQWAWAEEPFKLVWAVRSDGSLLSLTFVKEQEMIAWAHSDTQGSFKSIATVTEIGQTGLTDAVYFMVQRSVGGQTVQYVERLTELYYPYNYVSSWQVDAGVQYSGAAATNFYGVQHLASLIVTGLADGVVIPPFTMPASGSFTLATPASVVTIGLAFTPQLQTLAIDIGEPTVQGKRKKITAVTVRVANTLGLSIGGDSSMLVPMKDLVIGNIGTMTNGVVTGFVTGDARTIIDPNWTVPGQYFIQQSYPFPASILGVIPEITVGDTVK